MLEKHNNDIKSVNHVESFEKSKKIYRKYQVNVKSVLFYGEETWTINK